MEMTCGRNVRNRPSVQRTARLSDSKGEGGAIRLQLRAGVGVDFAVEANFFKSRRCPLHGYFPLYGSSDEPLNGLKNIPCPPQTQSRIREKEKINFPTKMKDLATLLFPSPSPTREGTYTAMVCGSPPKKFAKFCILSDAGLERARSQPQLRF
jgi:hypothetical protein